MVLVQCRRNDSRHNLLMINKYSLMLLLYF